MFRLCLFSHRRLFTSTVGSFKANSSITRMASSQKCQGKECPAPGPVPNGLIRLYSMRFCPFAQRARLVLTVKGVKHEIINIHLKNKPDWFLEKNPSGTVPVLETSSGQVIYESPITCEYLDEVYPEKKLFPSEPFERAQQRMLLEHFSKVIPYIYKIAMGQQKGEDVSAAESEFTEKLVQLNETLVKQKSKYFGGDSVTMIDYLMWPWFERFDGWMNAKHCLANTPELNKWIELMFEDPAVKATMFSAEYHKLFLEGFMSGKPDYDYGL